MVRPTLRRDMVEKFLEADDPVLERVLEWTVIRDAADVGQLMEWLPTAASQRDKMALLQRAQALMKELDGALHQLANMQ